MMELKGAQFGVKLFRRGGQKDPKVAALILSEDDGNWHDNDNWFDASWLDDLITQLQRAKTIIESDKDIFEEDPRGCGYRFKKTEG